MTYPRVGKIPANWIPERKISQTKFSFTHLRLLALWIVSSIVSMFTIFYVALWLLGYMNIYTRNGGVLGQGCSSSLLGVKINNPYDTIFSNKKYL